jgi:plasmid stabilization system protein ParE
MQNNTFTFDLAQKAKQDILEICKYIKITLKNPKAATDLNDNFEKAFETASQFPYGGIIYKKKYRKIIINHYIAFYKINETEKQILECVDNVTRRGKA